MKKAGIFAVVISIIMLFMHFYNYRLLAYTDELSFVIDTESAAANLKKDFGDALPDEEETELKLRPYESQTPVYTRMGGYYIGKDFEKFNIKYPVYTNDGSRLKSYGDEIQMISSDFSILDTYEGLYIVDGTSYNQDRTKADDEEFIFIKTGDGLFMNVQDMKLESVNLVSEIAVNSLMNLKEDSISYYSFENGKYVYNNIPITEDTRVEIGSVSMLYKDLLSKLKNLSERDKGKQETVVETEETEPETEAYESEVQESSTVEETQANNDVKPENEDSEALKKTDEAVIESSEASENQTETESIEETDPLHPPYPGKDNKWPFSQGGSGDDENFASGDDGSEDEDGEGDSDSGDTQGNNNDKFKAPEISLSNFKFGVYNITADVKIDNPNQLKIRNIKLNFYKKDDSRVSFRKTIYSEGTVKFKPLRPDTEYEVEGYFEFEHPEYGKVKIEFFPRQYVGKTLPVSTLNPIYIYQEPELKRPSTFSVKLNNIKAETHVNGSKIEIDAYNEDTDALMNLAAVQLGFEKKGSPDWQSPEATFSNLILNDLRTGKITEWKSKDILDSNSSYEYKLKLYDRYGNELPAVSEAVLSGSFRTSKQLPKAYVNVEAKSPITKKGIKIEISNEDKAVFKKNAQGTVKPYLYITYADRPDVPISMKLSDEKEEKTYHILERNSESLYITNLLSNTAYTIWVKASYDCEDGLEHDEEVIGSGNLYTEALSTLGTVNFSFEILNITSESADIEISKRGTVNENLIPFIETFEFKITDPNGEIFTYRINKSELERVRLAPESEYTYKTAASETGLNYLDPEISIINKSKDELSAWDSFFRDGIIKVSFKEKGLNSASRYKVEMAAIGVRGTNVGGEKLEENVTGQNKQDNFTTLKKQAYFDYKTSYISDDQATFYGFKIVDPDGAILNDKVVIRLRLANGAELDARVYSIDEINKLGKLQYTGLEKGISYVVSVNATEYNEGYDNTSLEYQKTLYRPDGSTISFKTENTMYGNIVIDRVQTDYEMQQAEDGIGVSGNNLFDINDCEVDSLIKSDGSIINSNGWLVSDYIPVEPGKNYIKGVSASSSTFFYDKDHKLLGRMEYNGMNKYSGLVHVPDNAYYVRFNVHIYSAPSMYFAEALFSDEESGGKNLLDGVKLIPDSYLNVNGNEVTVKPNKDYSYTDKIPVEADRMYSRYGSLEPFLSNGLVSTVYMFDKNDNFVKALYYGEYYANIVIPEGVSYIRMNVKKGYEDSIYLGIVSDKIFGPNLLNGKDGFKDGTLINSDGIEVKNSLESQRVSDYIKVVPNSAYEAMYVTGCALYDDKKNFIGYSYRSDNSGIKIPENCHYVRVNVNFGENDKIMPELRRGAPAYTKGQMQLNLAVDIHDQADTLGSAPQYYLHYIARDESGAVAYEDTEIHKIDFDENRDYYTSITMPVKPDLDYYFEILVEQGEERIALSSANINTGRHSNIIKSEAALYAVTYNPTESYYVSKDIKLTRERNIDNFYGHLDFGGHTLSLENMAIVFGNIKEGAVVENLVADVNIDSKNIGKWRGALCFSNYGLIKNLILKIGLNNNISNEGIGGIAYNNYGTVENFAIQLTDDFKVLNYASPGIVLNYGTVRNGYLLSGNHKIITDAAPSGGRAQRAGLVAENSGNIENVYSVVDIEDIHDESATSSERMGTITAYSNSGSVKNALGVGVTLSNGQAPVKYGPAVGVAVEGGTGFSNISYVETRDNLNASRYNNTYNNRVSVNSLHDKVWVDNAINSTSAFKTEMIDAGYYPQLKMPKEMDNKQPQMRLPERTLPAAPEVVSTSVISNENNKAVIKIGFINRSYLDINKLKLSVLDNSKTDGIKNFRKIDSDIAIISQGIEEDGVYYVTAEVKSVELYRSQYFIDSFSAGLKGYEDTYKEYDNPKREFSELLMEFYREVKTVDEWREAFLKNNLDEFGNIRITADELDFSHISESDYTTAYRVTSNFRGKIDGAHISENGQVKNAVIRNMKLGKFSYLFGTFNGSIKNLYFDNISLNTSKNATGYSNVGLIATASGATIENVHISNSKSVTGYRSGLLVGTANGNTQIVNCSVTNSSIESMNDAVTILNIGGLVGTADDADIMNSFVQGIEINAIEGLEGRGIGGIVGFIGSANCSVKNCLAEGSISSMFNYAGGICGYSDGSPVIENNLSMVDMDIYGGFVGGIIGHAGAAKLIAGNLSLGDVFTHSTSLDSIHRIFGYVQSEMADNYAFNGQMLLNGISDNKDDAKALLTKEQLSNKETYADILKWNDSYAHSWIHNGEVQDISKGYLPMLKGTDGNILPNQKPMQINETDISLTETLMEINSDYVDDYHRLIDKGALPQELINPYQLHFVLSYDSSKYSFDCAELSMDGVNLNTTINGKNGYEETVLGNRHVFNFHFVKEIFGGDIYCLRAKLRELSTGRVIEVTSSVKPVVPISIRISNAREWNEKLKGAVGTSYPNVVLTGNIDFSGLKDEDNVYNVKLNSLTSDGGTYTISGINHEINKSRDNLITEILSRADNVKFEDITWKVPLDPKEWKNSSTKIGIIGTNSGKISNVEFSNIEIDAGVCTNTGCIGYNIGSLSDIKLKDIKVRSEGNNTGGLVGYTKYVVNRIQAEGSISGELGAEDTKYGYEIVGNFNVGGICGHGSASDKLDVKGIHVVGNGNWKKTSEKRISSIGGIVGSGTIPSAGSTQSEQKENRSKISDSLIETMNENPEGTVSIIYGVASGNSYYVDADNIIVRSSRGDNVGGISSSPFDFSIKNSTIKGYSNVGGAVGIGYAHQKGYVDKCNVEAYYENAGGVVGKCNTIISNNIVDRTTVKAPVSVGGIIGCNGGKISVGSNLVSRSVIKSSGTNVGGIVGTDATSNPGSISRNAVMDTKIDASCNMDTMNSYAGGIIGYTLSTENITSNFVRDSEITAQGNCVGGIAGYSDGSQIVDNYFADSVVDAEGSYAGGIVGRLDGDNRIDDTQVESMLYNAYVKGDIKAKSYAGGFVGYYSKNQNENSPVLDGSRMHSLVMLGNVESEFNRDFIMNIDPSLGYEHNEEYIRLYEHSKLITVAEDGQKISEETAKDKYKDYWYTFKPTDAGGSAETGNEMLKKSLLVRNTDLYDGRLYSLSHEKGGLNWINNWKTEPTGRMDEERESDIKAFPVNSADKKINLTVNGKQIPLDTTNLYDAGDKIVTATIVKDDKELFDNCEIRWYRSYGGRYDMIDLQLKDKDSIELAGRGYYLARVYDKDANRYYYSNIIKVQTKGYMPVLGLGNNQPLRGSQEGILPDIGEDDSLINEDGSYNFYDGTDALYYGGIEIPGDASSKLKLEPEASDINIKAYPSGIETVNIELPNDYEDVSMLTVYDGDKLLYQAKPEGRVISLKYGYKSNLTVKAESINTAGVSDKLSASNAPQTYSEATKEFDSSELRRTVMLWGDDYYYTCNGQLMNSQGVVLDKDIIHLYKGKALDADGNVYELNGADNVNELADINEPDTLSSEAQTANNALFETQFEDKTFKTYGGFTEIYDGEQGEALIQEKQLIVKNGKLYSFESCDISEGYVIDEYNGLVYASILNSKSELKDMADHIRTPDGFSRKNIAHMTTNTDSELPYLIVRYKSGEAKGFNYITGEELELENAFSDISLFDFALAHLNELLNPSEGENPEFAELRELKEKLNLNPIKEEELLRAEEILSAKESEEEAEKLSDDMSDELSIGSDKDGISDADGTSEVDGSSNSEGLSNANGDLNTEALSDADVNSSVDGSLDKSSISESNGSMSESQTEATESIAEENVDIDDNTTIESEGMLAEPDNTALESEIVHTESANATDNANVSTESNEVDETENATTEAVTDAETSDKIAENTAQKVTSDKYVYSFNAETGDTEIFNKSELLSKKSAELKSEQEKQEIIEAAGIYEESSVSNKKEDVRDVNEGMYLFILAILSALGLSFILIRKKK
ncbi:MAG: hypothetical protein Q4B86_04815 [Eubacteriales bacterium]|nr:hypothetical protein [Eubacteriales bacterium]